MWVSSGTSIISANFQRLSKALKKTQGGGGTLQLKIRGGGWLDSLGSEILVGKDILGFLKNTDLDNS